MNTMSENEYTKWRDHAEELRSGFVFHSSKTYRHSIGLSGAFRQWRAESHCRFIHGYSLQVHFDFFATELDVRNWVVDFGSLKSLKSMLESTFDHKTLVAFDDPELAWFQEAHKRGVIDMVIVPATGCEMFAALIFETTEQWLSDNGYSPRVNLQRVEVHEHEANSAYVERN